MPDAQTYKRSILFAFSLIILSGAYGVLSREIDKQSRDDARVWIRKLEFSDPCDMIVLGDSRVYRDVAPEVVSPILNGIHVLNYGFEGTGMDKRYLNSVDKVLSQTSNPLGKRIIVIGVTPRCLTDYAALTSQFNKWSGTTSVERYNLTKLYRADRFFTSENPVLLFGRVVSKGPQHTEEIHSNGWTTLQRTPRDEERSLDEYSVNFKKSVFSSKLLEELLTHIKLWSKAGYSVICFRPPTYSKMIDLENNMSGYDEQIVRARVAEAGALWLDLPQTKYPTSDGSHLDPVAAVEFSRDFATLLRQKSAILSLSNATR